MEKRLLSAVFLSLLVLYIWAALTHPGRNKDYLNRTSQDIENKEVKEKSPLPTALTEKAKNLPSEAISTLENEQLTVTFSNLGAAIKSIYIKNYETDLPILNIGSLSDYKDIVF